MTNFEYYRYRETLIKINILKVLIWSLLKNIIFYFLILVYSQERKANVFMFLCFC